MGAVLVADRFLALPAGGWRDLATGHLAHVVVSPADERIVECAGIAPPHRRRLLDQGRWGLHRRFEAYACGARAQADPAAIAAATRSANDLAARFIPRDCQGTRVGRVAVDGSCVVEMVAECLASALRAVGFVTVRASIDVPRDLRHSLEHRHLCVLAWDDADRARLGPWLRRLNRVSTRAHLVVLFEATSRADSSPELAFALRGLGDAALSGGRAPEPSVVRESSPVWADERSRPPTDRRLARARHFARRGRHASAGRWYRAALESARRRGDDKATAAACHDLVRWLRRHDQWDAAHRRTQEALAALRDTHARLAVSALAVHVSVARAECAAAEAIRAGAAAEAAAANLPVPIALRAAEAELRFWQGRLDDAIDVLGDLPPHPAALMTRSLAAWLRRDPGTLLHAAGALAEDRSAVSRLQHATVAMLHSALVGEAPQVNGGAEAVDRLARQCGCPRLARLTRLLAVEARAFARCAVNPPRVERAVTHAPLLDKLLHAWHEACRDRDRPGEARAGAELVRAGVGVVRVWRWGSSDMHLVHSIPILLQLVQDAEDDQSALVAACGWIRREADADAAAFLASDHTAIAADGWTAADTADLAGDLPSAAEPTAQSLGSGDLLVRAPVRYAGTVTGLVVIRGPEGRRRAMFDAAQTAAALCGPALRARIDIVSSLRGATSLAGQILGRSPAVSSLREAIARTAATPFPVLIEGESGTGKELVARAIHRLSPRRDRRFSAVNAAALTDELVEAELFGHSRGAFTGAVAPRAGLFEDAHGGSLFLDEVSELSARAQAKLLRALQEREIRRVGENTARPVDVRIIAATNRPLAEAVRAGAFRGDLLFRLAVVTLRLPPLRDRIEDVPILAQASWRALGAETGKRAVLAPDAIARLCRHHWPGNVRELQNAMAALIVAAPDRGRVSARHVHAVLAAPDEGAAASPLSLDQTRVNCERTAVLRALVRNGGRRMLAARELGLTRQGLTKAMKRLKLDDRHSDAGVA